MDLISNDLPDNGQGAGTVGRVKEPTTKAMYTFLFVDCLYVTLRTEVERPFQVPNSA